MEHRIDRGLPGAVVGMAVGDRETVHDSGRILDHSLLVEGTALADQAVAGKVNATEVDTDSVSRLVNASIQLPWLCSPVSEDRGFVLGCSPDRRAVADNPVGEEVVDCSPVEEAGYILLRRRRSNLDLPWLWDVVCDMKDR